jgi:small ligand-binding sensory domain FIST
MAATVQTLLDPFAFIGASAGAVLAGAHGVEASPGVVLWAGRLPGVLGPVHVSAQPAGGVARGWTFAGLTPELVDGARSLVLMADPFTFPLDPFLGEIAGTHPGLSVIGGLASAAHVPGANRLLIGGRVARHGAVGVLLASAAAPRTVVSQGCRPIGRPFTVTRAERNVVFELGGRPALARAQETVQALPDEDRELAARGLHCGIVADDSKLDFERGDFLVRGVLGADPASGSITVGEIVPVGATLQFQVRDAVTASEDLRVLLAGNEADAALVFTCNGRGARMFGTPHHDAQIVSDHVGAAVAGMFCAGEIGPVGARNAVHGFTASVALFSDH